MKTVRELVLIVLLTGIVIYAGSTALTERCDQEVEKATALKGDMNGDGDLTIVDLSILAEHIRSLNQQKQSI